MLRAPVAAGNATVLTIRDAAGGVSELVTATSFRRGVRHRMLEGMGRGGWAVAFSGAVAAGVVGHITGMRMDHADVDRTVVIPMRDNVFDVDGVTVRRGETVRLVFHNQGRSFHEAVLDGPGAQATEHDHAAHERATAIRPGSASELVHRFGSAPVVIACYLPGHAESGMRAELRPR